MAEMLQYQQYRLRYTLFRNAQLGLPTTYPIAKLQLPRYSILHYVAVDGVTVGPQASDQIFLTTSQMPFIEHVTKYNNPIGSPIRAFSNVDLMITNYRRVNRIFRPLRKLERLEADPRSTVIFNYSLLAHVVKYAASFRASWYMWRNIYQEVVNKVNELGAVSNRQQFIEMELPEVMPALSALREYSSRQTSDTLSKIRTPELKMVADLFMWSGKMRHMSLLGQIKPEYYSKVNLIVRRMNGWVVLNLGWLNDLRSDVEPVDGEDEKQARERAKGMDPAMFSLRVLKLLTLIHQATTPIATDTAETIVQDPLVEENPEDAAIDVQDFNVDDEDPQQNSEELVDDDAELQALERELEELDKLKESVHHIEEQTDDEGNIIETAPIDIDALIAKGKPAEPGQALINKADEMASKGLLSPGEYRRLVKISNVFETLPDPYGSDKTFKEAMEIPEEDLIIKPVSLTDDDVVTDPSLTHSRVDAMEKQYIEKIMAKDIMRCVSSMQRGAVAITGYSIDRYTDAVNDRETHIVKFTPALGVTSTIKIPVPVIKPNGTFLYNGTNYRMRKQRADLPIRKVSPTRVALSSYYAKVFVERSARKKFSYSNWLLAQLILKCRDPDDAHISKAVISTVANYKADVPLIYSTIAGSIAAFTVDKYDLFFDYNRRVEKMGYSAEELQHEKPGWVLVGRNRKTPLLMGPNGMIYAIEGEGLVDIDTIENLAGIETNPLSTPTYMAEMKIYSKTLPTGFCLAYLLGIDGLLKVIKAKPRRVVIGEKLNLQSNEYAIRFKNETLVFNRDNIYVSMLMSGFNLYQNVIKNYDIELFNDRDVYAAVLDRDGTGSRYLRELDSMNIFFVDPMTEDLLRWMNEPTTYTELLLRAVQMLVTDVVKSRRDDKTGLVQGLERVRGYERIPGMIYETMSKAMRAYNARVASGRSSVQINPNDVTNAIVQDPTTAPVNNINPVHALREREVITFGGRGGRSRRAMVASARLFTDEDMGLISEGTVDSGDVAIITYLAPNANITTARGTTRIWDKKRDGASSIMSTAALLSFGADGDDPKRINFINVQHGHGIMTVGSEVQGCRTGMERVLASRMGPEFAVTAEQDGEVTEVAEDSMAVTYKDGSVGKYPLGLIHTSAEGSIYPHTILSGLKVGEKFKQFDVVTYNSGFFKPSPLDPSRVDYMNGCIGRVALREATYTVEDSSSLSVAFASRMLTNVSKLKPVRINFTEGVEDLVKVGDTVDLDTILCTIRGAVSSAAGLYDDDTRETLGQWGAAAPRAKAVGVVADIEVFYNGDIDEMSDTLQEIVIASEKRRRRAAKRLGKDYTPGAVPRNVRIEGYNLEARQAVILVYITTPVGMGVGDKLVIANQMKSTVGAILFGDNRTLSGETVDLIFGAKSCIDRIVTSPFVIGSTNTALRYIGESAYEMYFGDDQ
jgi:hypothetical protein